MSRHTSAPLNSFGQPGMPFESPHDDQNGSIFEWLSRHLRGRWLLAALLVPLAVAGGGVVGYHTVVPTWRSAAVLQYKPEASPILYGSRTDDEIPMFDAFLESQRVAIRHPDIIRNAMADPVWTAMPSADRLDANAFRAALSVDRTKRQQTVQVVFQHKDATAARAGVQAVVAAYTKHFRAEHEGENQKKLRVLETYLDEVIARRDALKAREMRLTNAYQAAGLAQLQEAKLAEISDLEKQIRVAEQQRAVLRGQGRATQDGAGNAAQTPEEIERNLLAHDQIYADLAASHQAVMDGADRIRARTGDRHLQVIYREREAEGLRKKMEARAAELRANPGSLESLTDALVDSASEMDALDGLTQTLEEQLARAEVEAAEVGRRRVQIREIENDLAATQQLITDTQFKMETQRLEAHRDSLLTVVTNGDTPNRQHMGRKQIQAGFVGGAGAGVFALGLIVLRGLFDVRIRGYEDVRDHFPQKPVLALVPTLQGDMSDPEESLTAAMAIHEIRARLQRTFGHADDAASDDRAAGNVLTLTGPTPGVGKTTLAMALAMSFARTGTRTLLIDLDLVGRGVTERSGLQNVAEGSGVLAALAGAEVTDCCHPSLVRHLWVMPASRHGERRVADLSRKHVQHLVNAARKDFDTVLIDTGPMLGSLECSLVLPESDEVVLIVSRGDAGPVVRQAVERLGKERIRLAGIIFNRAKPRDCERFSSSLTSRTSQSSQPVHLRPPAGALAATRDYGPVAYATASCLTRDN